MNLQNKTNSHIPEKCIKCGDKVPWVCFFSNFTLGIFKMTIGYLSGSKGLFADGVHSFSDVIATTGVIISLKIARKPEDGKYPYGRGKVEFISCIFVYAVLLAVSILILYGAVKHILAVKQTAPNLISLFSAFVSVTANVILYRLGMCAGKQLNSPAIIANANENKADMYSSIAVILGITGSNLGYYFCDPLAAIIVGLIIFKTATSLGWKAIEALIDTSVPPEKLKLLNKIVRNVKGVDGVNYIKTRQIGKQFWLDIEVQVSPKLSVKEGDEISKNVREELMRTSGRIKDVVVTLSCEKPAVKKSLFKKTKMKSLSMEKY
ncbi:cation diffusion facilitator family transporter [candidate division KSB1 bacterium]